MTMGSSSLTADGNKLNREKEEEIEAIFEDDAMY